MEGIQNSDNGYPLDQLAYAPTGTGNDVEQETGGFGLPGLSGTIEGFDSGAAPGSQEEPTPAPVAQESTVTSKLDDGYKWLMDNWFNVLICFIIAALIVYALVEYNVIDLSFICGSTASGLGRGTIDLSSSFSGFGSELGDSVANMVFKR